MTNSTSTFWDVDGTSLQTLAFNITTQGGDRLAPPPVRGRNTVVPRRRGSRRGKKIVDARVMSLQMWCIGSTEAGAAPSSGTRRTQFLNNWKKIVDLLFQPNREFVLTKRFYDTDGTTLIQASINAEYQSGLNPTMMGEAGGIFTVDLSLASAYFLGLTQSHTLVTGSNTVTVKGDDTTTAMTITVNGPRTNPKINNTTLGVFIQYVGVLATGDTWVVNVDDFTSVTTPAATAAFNSEGSIAHSGDDFWLRLAKGNNTVVVTSDSGTGVITLVEQPVYR